MRPAEQLPNGFMPSFQPPQQPLPMAMMQQAAQQMDMPPISQMLVREADAWRALLGLHGSVLHLARGMSEMSVQETNNPHLVFDEQREGTEQREVAYVASITQLVSQCDLLVSEAVKIRGLRKAKFQAEGQALKEVLRNHSNEVLAMGEGLARNSALGMSAVTSELRQAAQGMRAQIQQARALVGAAAELRSLGPMPPNAVIVMGWQAPEDLSARQGTPPQTP